MGDMVTGSIILTNWDPRYLNLLWNLVNEPIPAKIDTSLAATPPPILLEPMTDGDAGSTAVRIRCTVYVSTSFFPILLDGELSPTKNWQRLEGALITSNIEADCRTVINWLWVALVRSAPNSLFPLLTYEPTTLLVDAVILKHCHTMLICDHKGIGLSTRRATGSLIATNIVDLVLEQRVVRLEAEALRKRKEDKGVDTLFGTAYRALLNLWRLSDLTVQVNPLWSALVQAPKYRQLLEL